MAKKSSPKKTEKKSVKKAGTTKKTAKKTVKKKKTTKRKKSAAEARKRVVWVVFNNNMKEEGRFPYDQRKEAEKKIEQLAQKSKKPFFIQPVKEVIAEDARSKKKASSEEE